MAYIELIVVHDMFSNCRNVCQQANVIGTPLCHEQKEIINRLSSQ